MLRAESVVLTNLFRLPNEAQVLIDTDGRDDITELICDVSPMLVVTYSSRGQDDSFFVRAAPVRKRDGASAS